MQLDNCELGAGNDERGAERWLREDLSAELQFACIARRLVAPGFQL